MQAVTGDPNLRSKQELIDKFIKENLPNVKSAEEVDDALLNENSGTTAYPYSAR